MRDWAEIRASQPMTPERQAAYENAQHEIVTEIIALAIDDACVGADAEGVERAAQRVLDHLTEAGYRVTRHISPPDGNCAHEWEKVPNVLSEVCILCSETHRLPSNWDQGRDSQ